MCCGHRPVLPDPVVFGVDDGRRLPAVFVRHATLAAYGTRVTVAGDEIEAAVAEGLIQLQEA